MPKEGGELLNRKRFPPKLKGAVYNNYEKPAIPHGSESYSLNESEIGILQGT